jgi:hypothetical protein
MHIKENGSGTALVPGPFQFVAMCSDPLEAAAGRLVG